MPTNQYIGNGTLDVTDVASLEHTETEWLWEQRIPRGAITFLVGDPGVGKSTLTYRLAAQLSSGSLAERPQQTILLNAEDHPSSTIKSRLQAAGADDERVLIVNRQIDGMQVPVQIPEVIPELTALAQRRNVGLIVIDPLVSHLGARVDVWKDQSIRQALAPLHRMAEETNAAVLAVGHFNKRFGSDPLRRIGGSIGIPAASRSVLLFGKANTNGPDTGERVLVHVKSNLGRLAPSLAYQLEERILLGVSPQPVAYLDELGESELTAQDLLDGFSSEGSALGEAMAFLTEELGAEAVPVAHIEERAREREISPRTLTRAKRELGVRSQRRRDRWYWSLERERRET